MKIDKFPTIVHKQYLLDVQRLQVFYYNTMELEDLIDDTEYEDGLPDI